MSFYEYLVSKSKRPRWSWCLDKIQHLIGSTICSELRSRSVLKTGLMEDSRNRKFPFWKKEISIFWPITAHTRCVLERNNPSLWLPKVRVPQLKVDGSGERGLSCAAQSLHPPGLPGLGRDVDAPGGQLWQAETDQQRAGRPGARMCHNNYVQIHLQVILFIYCNYNKSIQICLFQTIKMNKAVNNT